MQADARSSEGRGGAPPTRAFAGVAAWLLRLQAAMIVAFAVFFVIEAARGEASDPSAVVTSVAVFLLAAMALAALGRGWMAGRRWPRTPTMVWQALLLPVGWSLAETHHVLIAAGVLGLALLGLVVGALAGRGRGSEDADAGVEAGTDAGR